MQVLTFSRVHLDEAPAHAINIVNTSAAMVRAGARVKVHADIGGRSREAILRSYGTEAGPGLTFRDMSWRWHRLALPLVAGGLLKAGAREPSVLFVNEVRPFVLTLMRAAKQRGLKVAFEAHNAAGRMAREKAGAGVAGGRFTVAAPEADPHGAPATAGVNLMGGYKLPEETEEERAGRERATPKPDPKAIAEAARREALERAILASADVLLAPQRLTLEAIKDLARPGVPSFAIPNATLLPPPAPPRPKDIDIVYCGAFDEWKGVDDVVAALPKLFPYKLTLVGTREGKNLARLKEIALKLGVISRVEFRPPVPPAQVWDLYARAKVGVVPLHSQFLEAREYTCPVKLFEMMAAGLPMVTARLASVQEFVTEGQEVLMAKSDSPDEYAAALRKLLEDPDLGARLAANGRARVADFTYDRRAARFLEAFAAAT
jgi:glycosyltransferase involved in cell wall biosynthesis